MLSLAVATTRRAFPCPAWCGPAGLARAFDSPNSLPCIAPRPLLVATGETDPRCPLPGESCTPPCSKVALQMSTVVRAMPVTKYICCSVLAL